MTKLLEGIVSPDNSAVRQSLQDALNEVDRLKNNMREGFEILRAKDQEIDKLKRIISNMQQQLNPLHRAMRALFGEIDLAGIDESTVDAAPSSTPATTPAKSAIWESWKQKLPGAKAAIIDALLQHGELSVEQLCVMTKITRKQTIYDATNALKKIHLINGNNGRYSLKAI